MKTNAVSICVLLLAGILLLRVSTANSLKAPPKSDSGAASPVLIELFTSEGCSDCPPADVLLQKLDRAQPVKNADLIVLSEHVDYWDHIGWKDPYSSHASSERQGLYAQQLDLDTVYTPQMIVDGVSEFVGSNEARALRAIQKTLGKEKLPVALSSIRMTDGSNLEAHLRIDPLPSAVSIESAGVFIGVADEMDDSRVAGGENAGRELKHVAVLRKLADVGTVSKEAGFDKDVAVRLDSSVSDRLRIVAFIQEPGPRRILGVASAHFTK